MINFNPGPSQPHPQLAEFMHSAQNEEISSLSHRSSRFADIYYQTATALRELMQIPPDYHIWFVSSATEAMERIIQNTTAQHSHHVITGAFAERFATIAKQLGKTITTTSVPWGQGIDLETISVPNDAGLLAITHNETSTGVQLPADAIHQLAKHHPRALIAVDVVSSAPFQTVMPGKVDLMFFSVQKAFGLPAGLGVLIASPRSLKRAVGLQHQGAVIGSYHSFPELAKYEAQFHTPETPNVLGIYLLQQAVQSFLDEGLAGVHAQLTSHAATLYQVAEAHPHLRPLVSNPAYRSATVVVAEVTGGNAHVIDSLSACGHQLGQGYAHQKATHIRIANFPAHARHIPALADTIQQWRPDIIRGKRSA